MWSRFAQQKGVVGKIFLKMLGKLKKFIRDPRGSITILVLRPMLRCTVDLAHGPWDNDVKTLLSITKRIKPLDGYGDMLPPKIV